MSYNKEIIKQMIQIKFNSFQTARIDAKYQIIFMHSSFFDWILWNFVFSSSIPIFLFSLHLNFIYKLYINFYLIINFIKFMNKQPENKQVPAQKQPENTKTASLNNANKLNESQNQPSSKSIDEKKPSSKDVTTKKVEEQEQYKNSEIVVSDLNKENFAPYENQTNLSEQSNIPLQDSIPEQILTEEELNLIANYENELANKQIKIQKIKLEIKENQEKIREFNGLLTKEVERTKHKYPKVAQKEKPKLQANVLQRELENIQIQKRLYEKEIKNLSTLENGQSVPQKMEQFENQMQEKDEQIKAEKQHKRTLEKNLRDIQREIGSFNHESNIEGTILGLHEELNNLKDKYSEQKNLYSKNQEATQSLIEKIQDKMKLYQELCQLTNETSIIEIKNTEGHFSFLIKENISKLFKGKEFKKITADAITEEPDAEAFSFLLLKIKSLQQTVDGSSKRFQLNTDQANLKKHLLSAEGDKLVQKLKENDIKYTLSLQKLDELKKNVKVNLLEPLRTDGDISNNQKKPLRKIKIGLFNFFLKVEGDENITEYKKVKLNGLSFYYSSNRLQGIIAEYLCKPDKIIPGKLFGIVGQNVQEQRFTLRPNECIQKIMGSFSELGIQYLKITTDCGSSFSVGEEKINRKASQFISTLKETENFGMMFCSLTENDNILKGVGFNIMSK